MPDIYYFFLQFYLVAEIPGIMIYQQMQENSSKCWSLNAKLFTRKISLVHSQACYVPIKRFKKRLSEFALI